MLLLLVFFYVSSTYPSNGQARTANLCILPPHPKNGHYEVLEPEIPNLSPGDKLHNYTLDVKCDSGYRNTEYSIFTCFEGGTSFGLMSECLHVSSTYPSNGQARTANLCILPPHPKNGHYEVLEPEIPNLSPGDELHNYTLDVKCDSGYRNTEYCIFTCFEDGTSFGLMSECLPECKRERYQVLSCGVGQSGVETRCIEPLSLSKPWDGDVGVVPRYTPVYEEGCGILPTVSGPFVSGGRSAKQHELPWHAGIYTKTKSPYMQICGGSLISETVVISAAHCFWNEVLKQLPASNYAVAVGKLYRPWNDQHDENAQKSDVAEIKIPPRFQGSSTNLQDDIALVIVSSPFKFSYSVRPVCLDFDVDLDRKQIAAGNEGQVAGWGLTSEDGPASPVLKVVEMPVIAIDQCYDKLDPSFKAHITSDKICAGYQNGTAVCKGDSGGGLSFIDRSRGDYRYFLRGVVSGAPRSDHLCNTVAWTTFTHVLTHQHFIRETVPEKTEYSAKTYDNTYINGRFLEKPRE